MLTKVPDELMREINEKGGIEKIKEALPSPQKIEKLAKIHHALSDPIRLKIIFFLKEQKSCVCLLREITNIAYSKLSYHLKILKNAGLIKSQKQGNYVIYKLTPLGSKCVENTAKFAEDDPKA